jgi:hypothetical protein
MIRFQRCLTTIEMAEERVATSCRRKAGWEGGLSNQSQSLLKGQMKIKVRNWQYTSKWENEAMKRDGEERRENYYKTDSHEM